MGHSLKGRYFYRCYSSASAGALRCGKYDDAPNKLSHHELLHEFANHRIRTKKVPTALVSVTVRPLEALQRALAKFYTPQEYAEGPKEIWIAILFVPDDAKIKPHRACELAQQSTGSKNTDVFKYEYLFEREIPKAYVKHNVSLEKLLEGGLSVKSFLDADKNFPSTLRSLQRLVMRELLDGDAYGVGRWLGGIARAFGIGAPFYEIAHNILSDCLKRFSCIDEDHQYGYFHWVDDYGNVELCGGIEFASICDIEDGIKDEFDSWLGL
ncbi:uncharacterized protein N7458_000004 [Penicillium daleae]|uniref:DUF7587 domain-containing protein n=1 Tax=Penicillium daleae TaxID=63821 RepID=A0AAD6CFS1_9EURO|nr:uncharacterized protein N7458_000004 [Penicillium daleae]KAJ5464318.1 hypothetical protein N7458_000004 [Penicillium daleae]